MSAQTLIIFAKLPRPGEVKTRLGQTVGMREAAEIYRLFAEHAFTLGRQLLERGSRVYVFHDPGSTADEMREWVGPLFHLVSQEGATLGDRMHRAFEHTFGEGSKHTVLIGTDVPELDLATLERAFDGLIHCDVVLGPSSDGGYYLIGMSTPAGELFDGVRWSSETVYLETKQRLQGLNLSFTELNVLDDIDTIADYKAYQERIRNAKHT